MLNYRLFNKFNVLRDPFMWMQATFLALFYTLPKGEHRLPYTKINFAYTSNVNQLCTKYESNSLWDQLMLKTLKDEVERTKSD